MMRQTQAAVVAKNREERLRKAGEGERTERRESSDTGGITAAESHPLADLGAFVTRTASSPPIPTTRVTASAAYVRPLVLL